MKDQKRATRLLIVEDSPTQAHQLQCILESRGFEVETAPDGQTALAQLKASPFDLVLSDILMPGLSGYELCRKIKTEIGKEVPVILLTTLNSPKDIIQGLECGADNFITKPYEPDYLIGRITHMLAVKALRATHKVEVGVELSLPGRNVTITSDREQIFDLLMSTFEEYLRTKEKEHASRLAEETARKSERFLQSALDALSTHIAILDHSGKIVAVNAAWRRFMEQSDWFGQRCAVGTNYLDLCESVSDATLEVRTLANGIREVMSKQREDFQIECRQRGSPEEHWFSVQVRRFEAVRPVRVVVSHLDITERKRASEAIKQRTTELAEANRHLAHKNQENELFVYSVSHDLRSPLVNLEGFSKELSLACREIRGILADNALPPTLRERGLALVDEDMAESIRFIQTGVIRLSNIIDALLRLSRAGRVEYQWQQVDVHATVRRIVESMSATIAERGATVTVRDLPFVWGDPTAVEQIFANLIGNALNYLDPRRPGFIELGSTNTPGSNGSFCHPDLRTCYVKDNGLGIPEAYKAKVFQAFQRLHSGVAKGEGIGLTLVHRIVERHGGKIWFESTEEGGTLFFVTLPAPKEQAPSAYRLRSHQPMLLPLGDEHNGR